MRNLFYHPPSLTCLPRRYMEPDAGGLQQGNGGTSLSSWLSSGYGAGAQFGSGAGHSQAPTPGFSSSQSPTPFDDGRSGGGQQQQQQHSILGFPADMSFGDPSLGSVAGLGGKMFGGAGHSIVTSSSHAVDTQQTPDLFSSRLQQQVKWTILCSFISIMPPYILNVPTVANYAMSKQHKLN